MRQLASTASSVIRMLGIAFAVVMAQSAHACDPHHIRLNAPVELTDSDKAFVRSLPPLKVAAIYAPPLVRQDAGSGPYQGISADVFCFIAEHLELKYEFLPDRKRSLAEHIKAVQDKSVDVFMPLSYKDSRAERGWFSEGYYQSYYVAIIDQQRELKISSLDDLNDFKVGVVQGAALESVLRSRLPDADIISLDDQNNQDIYQALLDKTVDVLIHNRNFFKEERYHHEVFRLESVYTLHQYPRTYRFYFSQADGHDRLIGLFNRFLANIDSYDSVVAHETGEKHLIEKYVAERSMRSVSQAAVVLFALLIIVLGYWLQKYQLLNKRLIQSNQRISEQQSRLQATNRELDLLSKMDPLTGLYNKRHLAVMMDQLSGVVEPTLPLSVMLIDVDRFKRVNDLYGHLKGDDYLRTIAGVIREHVSRKTDVAVRYGGEEFVCLLPNTPAADAYVLAERIRAAVAELGLPNARSENQTVTVSIGVATATSAAEDGATLLARADEQLYAAKRAGRNRTCSRAHSG